MLDSIENEINPNDIIIHVDHAGIWFGFVIKLHKSMITYRVLSRAGNFIDDHNFSVDEYKASITKVIVISNSEIAQKLRKFKSYKRVVRDYGDK